MTATTLSAREDTHWWRETVRLTKEAHRALEPAGRAAYRLGDITLEIDSTYRPLLDGLQDAYGDCAVETGTDHAGSRVACRARMVGDLVALEFEVAANIPHLCAVGATVLRPRAELQHFAVRPLEVPGWQLLADERDENAPLLAADARTVLFSPEVEPPDFLLNFVVAVAQLAQQSVMFVHSGGVSIGGLGTLIVGRSGHGKSTTTAALAGRSHPFFGDETVGIRLQSRELLAFRRTIKFRPGPRSEAVVARLGVAPYKIRKDAGGVDCVWVPSSILFPASPTPIDAPLHSVFFLRRFSDCAATEPFVPSLGDHLDELQPLTMTLSAIASWPFSPAQRVMRFARIADLFSKCRCYFLDLGTPDETAMLIERTVLDNA